MSVGCLRFNACNSLIHNFRAMPHASCVDLVKKAVVFIFYSLAIFFALVYDLVCDSYNYLCGDKNVKKITSENGEQIPDRGIWLYLNNKKHELFFENTFLVNAMLFGFEKTSTDYLNELINDPKLKTQWIVNCVLCYGLINNNTDILNLFPEFTNMNKTSQQNFITYVFSPLREREQYDFSKSPLYQQGPERLNYLQGTACIARILNLVHGAKISRTYMDICNAFIENNRSE